MATEIKGNAPCPDCNSIQPVKYDGRKYFINCSECRTLTSYQSKVAKARIEQRLQLNKPEPDVPTPDKQTVTEPKPVRSPSFWESLGEL